MQWIRARRLWQPHVRRGLALVVLCLGLTALPLFGTLGYENAFVLAPVLAGWSIMAGVDGVRSMPAGAPRRTLLRIGAREIASYHAIALGVVILGRLWQPGCDPAGGLQFYMMGPGLSSILGWSCGVFGASLSRRRAAAAALGFAPFGFCMFIGLWRLYADPVVFAYDPFWGYFSGSVYDESIRVDARYRLYRGYNLLALAAAWAAWAAAYDLPTRHWHRIGSSPTSRVAAGVATVATIVSLLIGLRPTRYGFTADVESLSEELSGRYETEHFVLHYPVRAPYARIIEDLGTEHEFAWARLTEEMGRSPAAPVHSFLFEDANQKRQLMGAGSVQVAAPWRSQIYLDHRGFPHAVMHHELAHVFGATIGDPILGLSLSGLMPNMALIEGFATAMAPRASGRLDLHDQAKVLGLLDRRPRLASIMGAGFLTQASRVAYIAAGSFCRWLIDTRGFESMAQLYRNGGDFEGVYGTSLDDLERQWSAFLVAYEGVSPRDVEAEAERFARRSVFSRPCAHVVAALDVRIRRAQRHGAQAEAIAGLEDLCALEPGEPRHQIALAMGLARDGQLDRAQSVLRALPVESLPATQRADITERLGDIALRADTPELAREAFDRALAEPIGDDERRVLLLKRWAADDPRVRGEIQRYFGAFASPADAIVTPLVQVYIAGRLRERPEFRAIGSYLLGRLMLNVQNIEAAHAMMTDAVALANELPDPLFARAARQALMTTSLHLEAWDEARRQWDALAREPDVGHGPTRELEEWRARIDFFAATSPS